VEDILLEFDATGLILNSGRILRWLRGLDEQGQTCWKVRDDERHGKWKVVVMNQEAAGGSDG